MAKDRPLPRDPVYRHPLQRFRKLMAHRIRRVLLVSSRYDSFLLGEDGRLNDLILSEFVDLNLGSNPWLTRVSTGAHALAAAVHRQIDLVIMTLHIRDTSVHELTRELAAIRPQLPIVPLAFDGRELRELMQSPAAPLLERPFVWQGDVRLTLGILQWLEDRANVEADTDRVGVSSVLLIEDSPHYYSSYLPMLYSELSRQSELALSKSANQIDQLMRMRARPKILHCTTYEEAEALYKKYRRTILGVISDVHFPHGGTHSPMAGLEFARMVRDDQPGLPILLQTNETNIQEAATTLQAAVLFKRSPLLLHRLSVFIRKNFGFGDFVFRDDDGQEVGRARDLRELTDRLLHLPEASVYQHASHNHFSTWLRARTEFRLAEQLRRIDVDQFDSPGELQTFLHETLMEFRREEQSGVVTQFDAREFLPNSTFALIGKGSMGGKARGLAFVRKLLSNYRVRRFFANTEISVPSAVVLATNVFERFMEQNDLQEFALECDDDALLEQRFLAARFPEDVFRALTEFLEVVDFPLAVRSSSLLEDSQDVSFTGVYTTYMVPNRHEDLSVRRRQLLSAIKRVYASTYSNRSKEYIAPSPYRLEEEKMAVIIQRLSGRQHGSRFYPDLSGVARSYNFYPVAPMKPSDGIVSIALGLGETVVAGGRAVSFCPLYPRHPIHYSTPEAIIENSQREFFALDLDACSDSDHLAELPLSAWPLDAARSDGTLTHVGSTYAPENHAVYDGIGRPGVPVVTFWGVLKDDVFPLPAICQLLLNIGARSMNRPVELEFAVNLPRDGARAQFTFLQMRPFVLKVESEDVCLAEHDPRDVMCSSTSVLGSGRITDVHHLVVVHRDRFDRATSREVATIVARMNAKLRKESKPYLLIGVGRWGASDPWLGIPVTWEQIHGARAIVESGLRDMEVVPSQGSHFFQNLTTSEVGYFTVGTQSEADFVDWSWLAEQPAVEEEGPVQLIALDAPVDIRMDGQQGCGVILKPNTATRGAASTDGPNEESRS